MLPNIHIYGIQGSGKDTQATEVANHFGYIRLSSGQLFRERMQLGDTIGNFIAQQIHGGHLLPDEFLIQVVQTALRTIPPEKGIVCAGVIRTVSQYKDLAPQWKEAGFEPPFGIFLEVSDEVAEQRALSRKRSDDTKEALTERFRAYHEQTEPIIALMEAEKRLVRINGERSVAEVFNDICNAVSSHDTQLHGSH